MWVYGSGVLHTAEPPAELIPESGDQETIGTWTSFLDFVTKAGVKILQEDAFVDAPPEILGEGATVTVFARELKSLIPGRPEKTVAVKKLKSEYRIPTSQSNQRYRDRPANERWLLKLFTLEVRALCHGSLRHHPNIVSLV